MEILTNPDNFEQDIMLEPEKYMSFITKHSARFIMKYSPKFSQHIPDVAQTVFYKVLKSKHRFDPTKGNIHSWLFAIVHNETLNYLKAEYTTTMKSLSLETTNFESENTMDNLEVIKISTDIFKQNGAEPIQNLAMKEIIRYLLDRLKPLDIEVLKCYLNPTEKLLRYSKKHNEDGSGIVYDMHIVNFLKITPQKLTTAKCKIYNLIHEWLRK